MTRRRRRPYKAPNLHGVDPHTFPASVRAYVDYDYTARLSPRELQWLSDFSDNHYGADFRRNALRHNQEQRRERYRAKNAANRDLYAYASVDQNEIPLGAVDIERDWADVPEALSSAEYKAALVELRVAIDTKADEHTYRRAERKVWRAALEDETPNEKAKAKPTKRRSKKRRGE